MLTLRIGPRDMAAQAAAVDGLIKDKRQVAGPETALPVAHQGSEAVCVDEFVDLGRVADTV